MATQSRPLVVLAGPINPDGQALLETEARVVVCGDETEAGLAKVAAEAEGILFRLRPNCTESLMARCPRLKVAGTASAWTPWTFPRPPASASRSCTPPARTPRRWRSTR